MSATVFIWYTLLYAFVDENHEREGDSHRKSSIIFSGNFEKKSLNEYKGE